MGYYTAYKFNVTGADPYEVETEIKKISGYSSFIDTVKWYNHELDVAEVSKKFPDAVICVSGIGEEYPDIWKKWFKNGKMKMARARIEFDEPEEYDQRKISRY